MYFSFFFFIFVFLSIFIGSSLSFTSVKNKQYAKPDTKPNEVIENREKEKEPEPKQQEPDNIQDNYIVKPKYFKVI